MMRFWFWVVCGGMALAQEDFLPPGYEEVSSSTMGSFGAKDKCGEGSQRGLFKCVEYHRCDGRTNTIATDEEVNTDGHGLIDIRMGPEDKCDSYLDVCCKIPSGGEPSTSPMPTEIPDPRPTPPRPTPIISNCGIRNTNGVDFSIVGNNNNEAEYGEFPWMVAILKKGYNRQKDNSPAVCGGSLIHPGVVLTGAHCVEKFTAQDIKVRAGEWDTQTEKERLPYQERDVTQVIVHEKFKTGVLFNDVALLVLNRPFKLAEHVATICLPEDKEVIRSDHCFATGWGKDTFGKEGSYQVILKKIELPLVERGACEAALRSTRLGKLFHLDESFICAGGVPGRDTCTGDGGSPLVCPDENNPTRYVQAGVVAWGIGCGTNIPGVYADVAKFRNWVDTQVKRLRLDIDAYTV